MIGKGVYESVKGCVSVYRQEGKVFLMAAACGFLLLFPRLLMVHEMVPSLRNFFEERMKKTKSSAGLKFQKTKVPVKSFSSPSLESQGSELHMEGLIFDPQGKSTVIINGQILVVGDQVENFTVKDIKPNEVILEKDRTAYCLSSESGLKKLKESNA